MCLICRIVSCIHPEESDDATISDMVDGLEKIDQAEHYASVELFRLSGPKCLGGLPLALVQAGTYIRHLECTFSQYLNRYKEANRKDEIGELSSEKQEIRHT